MSTVAQLQTMIAIKMRQRSRLEDALRLAQLGLEQARQEGRRLEADWVSACEGQQRALDRLFCEMNAGQRTRADDIMLLKRLHEACEVTTAQARQAFDDQQQRISQSMERLDHARREWSRCTEQIELLKDRLQSQQLAVERSQEDAQDEESEEGAVARRLREAHEQH